jgi:hypothetical protein
MWKWLNNLYRLASYIVLFNIYFGIFYKLLRFFIFQNSVPFTIELLLIGISAALLKNYHPYDLPDWWREK